MPNVRTVKPASPAFNVIRNKPISSSSWPNYPPINPAKWPAIKNLRPPVMIPPPRRSFARILPRVPRSRRETRTQHSSAPRIPRLLSRRHTKRGSSAFSIPSAASVRACSSHLKLWGRRQVVAALAVVVPRYVLGLPAEGRIRVAVHLRRVLVCARHHLSLVYIFYRS